MNEDMLREEKKKKTQIYDGAILGIVPKTHSPNYSEFYLEKDYVEWLRRRRDLFREVSGTKKTLRLTMIASAGIKQNMYASALQGKLSMEDLFL